MRRPARPGLGRGGTVGTGVGVGVPLGVGVGVGGGVGVGVPVGVGVGVEVEWPLVWLWGWPSVLPSVSLLGWRLASLSALGLELDRRLSCRFGGRWPHPQSHRRSIE